MPISILLHRPSSCAACIDVVHGVRLHSQISPELAPPGTSPAAITESIGWALTIDRETFDAV